MTVDVRYAAAMAVCDWEIQKHVYAEQGHKQHTSEVHQGHQ